MLAQVCRSASAEGTYAVRNGTKDNYGIYSTSTLFSIAKLHACANWRAN